MSIITSDPPCIDDNALFTTVRKLKSFGRSRLKYIFMPLLLQTRVSSEIGKFRLNLFREKSAKFSRNKKFEISRKIRKFREKNNFVVNKEFFEKCKIFSNIQKRQIFGNIFS